MKSKFCSSLKKATSLENLDFYFVNKQSTKIMEGFMMATSKCTSLKSLKLSIRHFRNMQKINEGLWLFDETDAQVSLRYKPETYKQLVFPRNQSLDLLELDYRIF